MEYIICWIPVFMACVFETSLPASVAAWPAWRPRAEPGRRRGGRTASSGPTRGGSTTSLSRWSLSRSRRGRHGATVGCARAPRPGGDSAGMSRRRRRLLSASLRREQAGRVLFRSQRQICCDLPVEALNTRFREPNIDSVPARGDSVFRGGGAGLSQGRPMPLPRRAGAAGAFFLGGAGRSACGGAAFLATVGPIWELGT